MLARREIPADFAECATLPVKDLSRRFGVTREDIRAARAEKKAAKQAAKGGAEA